MLSKNDAVKHAAEIIGSDMGILPNDERAMGRSIDVIVCELCEQAAAKLPVLRYDSGFWHGGLHQAW